MAKKKEESEVTLKDVLGAVNNLTEAVQKLVQPTPVFTSGAGAGTYEITNTPNAPMEPVQVRNGFPIPYEYQELVNTLLNKEFQIEINYLPDSNSFEFALLVPRKYSNAGESHWNTYKEDRRSKVLSNAYGANGVRDWCLQVYNNFSEETRSAITFDRAQP